MALTATIVEIATKGLMKKVSGTSIETAMDAVSPGMAPTASPKMEASNIGTSTSS